jgi:hypothetical protein
MLRLSSDRKHIAQVTIFEEKCTDNPRSTFLQKVIPAFLVHHRGARSAEVISAASSLLRMAGFDGAASVKLAAAVTDHERRASRAAFALTEDFDSVKERKKLFKDFNKLDALTQERRVGAGFIVNGELRKWFDHIAILAIAYLNELDVGEN